MPLGGNSAGLCPVFNRALPLTEELRQGALSTEATNDSFAGTPTHC